MRKSSIFSREYEKRIRRRRFFILLIIVIFSIILVYYIVNFSKFNGYVKNIYHSMITKENKLNDNLNNGKDSVESVTSNMNDENHNNTQNIDEIVDNETNENNAYLKYEVELQNNDKLNVLYEGEEVKFVGLGEFDSNKYKYDISPNKERILIENIINQDTYMLDNKFNLFKLDPEFFYSNSARTRFYKNDIVSSYENYAWYKDARFLDDNTIIYVSNLPWFGKDEEYIWRTDITNANDIRHFMTSVGGQNIGFGELTEGGIKVNINNEIKLLTFSFVLN